MTSKAVPKISVSNCKSSKADSNTFKYEIQKICIALLIKILKCNLITFIGVNFESIVSTRM